MMQSVFLIIWKVTNLLALIIINGKLVKAYHLKMYNMFHALFQICVELGEVRHTLDGLLSNDEVVYRSDIYHFVSWCVGNCRELNGIKIKEIVINSVVQHPNPEIVPFLNTCVQQSIQN